MVAEVCSARSARYARGGSPFALRRNSRDCAADRYVAAWSTLADSTENGIRTAPGPDRLLLLGRKEPQRVQSISCASVFALRSQGPRPIRRGPRRAALVSGFRPGLVGRPGFLSLNREGPRSATIRIRDHRGGSKPSRCLRQVSELARPSGFFFAVVSTRYAGPGDDAGATTAPTADNHPSRPLRRRCAIYLHDDLHLRPSDPPWSSSLMPTQSLYTRGALLRCDQGRNHRYPCCQSPDDGIETVVNLSKASTASLDPHHRRLAASTSPSRSRRPSLTVMVPVSSSPRRSPSSSSASLLHRRTRPAQFPKYANPTGSRSLISTNLSLQSSYTDGFQMHFLIAV